MSVWCFTVQCYRDDMILSRVTCQARGDHRGHEDRHRGQDDRGHGVQGGLRHSRLQEEAALVCRLPLLHCHYHPPPPSQSPAEAPQDHHHDQGGVPRPRPRPANVQHHRGAGLPQHVPRHALVLPGLRHAHIL